MDRPLLLHLPISHYSEKVRWALRYKNVDHRRRSPKPPVHMAAAFAVTRGKAVTLPVLGMDGRWIGDSTAIIAALEERFPQPPLHPGDPDDRRRALDLEDWFDEYLGPPMRVLIWHEVINDRERLEDVASRLVSSAPIESVAAAGVKSFTSLRYGVASHEEAERARSGVVEALDRLEAELGGGEYLVGDRFTVADLTAASLFYPLVKPAEGPQLLGELPEALKRFRAPLEDRPGFRWVAEMFRRHRRPADGDGHDPGDSASALSSGVGALAGARGG